MVTAQTVMEKLRAQDTEKKVGNIAAVVLLEQDPLLAKLVAVFENTPLPPLPLAAVAPPALPEGRHIRWLWSLLEPDPVPSWIEMAGLPVADHTRRLCQVAIDNRMVLPDGTVSRFAAQFIRALVGGTLVKRGVKEPPPPPAPAPRPAAPPAAPARTP